jgi:3-oxoacyl-(acyl-carrier-protein) synthase/NADP-dependent 3-hydroxy acid dehydrogenase YdfG
MSAFKLDNLFQENTWIGKQSDQNSATENDVAIVGVSIRLPFANGLDEFWDILSNGVETKHELSIERKEDCGHILKLLGGKQKPQFYDGCFLHDVAGFDAPYFGYNKRDAEYMSVVQRQMLQCAIESIEDAGYAPSQLKTTRTGVYIGYIGDGDGGQYMSLMKELLPSNRKAMSVVGSLASVIAGRISHYLDLSGPSLVVDTACSSSLVALHTAIRAIQNNDCDQAIVGAARILTLPVTPDYEIGMESSDGSTRAFDDSASGTGTGEGTVCYFIKKLDQANHDRDCVYAVIKGSAVNSDGNTLGVTAPNADAQERVLLSAWQDAGIRPEDLTYIEAHGTGTRLGDPIEITGLNRAIRRYTTRSQFCPIGSVKTNFGHLYETAGLTGIAKIISCIKYATIPKMLNFQFPNQMIDFIDSPVYVADCAIKISNDRALFGVSSFGFSGTNCHVVVSSYSDNRVRQKERFDYALPFSAKTMNALRAYLVRFLQWIRTSGTDSNIEDVAYTLNFGRDRHTYGIVIHSTDMNDLSEKLCTIIETMSAEEFLPELDEDAASLKYQHAARAHIPTYPFENIRHWFSDTLAPAHGKYFSKFLYSQYKPPITAGQEAIRSQRILMISSKADFEAFSCISQIPCQWQDFEGFNHDKVLTALQEGDSIGLVICQPDSDGRDTFQQLHHSAEIAENLLVIVKKLEQLNRLKTTPITLISRGLLLDDTECKYDFSCFMLYPYAICKNICNEFAFADVIFADIDNGKLGVEWVAAHYGKKERRHLIIRDGEAFVQNLVPADLDNESYMVSQQGCYIIFGAGGTIGNSLVDFLVENGASHIILAQRSKPQFNQQGTAKCLLEFFRCDLTDASEVDALFHSIEKRNLKVSGIAHCAGAAGGTLLRNMEKLGSQSVVAPKMEGLIHIEQAIKNHSCCNSLDFLLLCSSVMGLMGIPGQAQYAIGNTFMDLYAAKLRRDGFPACSVDWTAWSGTGIASEQGFSKNEGIINSISAKEARHLYPILLSCNAQRLVVGEICIDGLDDNVTRNLSFEISVLPEQQTIISQNTGRRLPSNESDTRSQEEIERFLLNVIRDITGQANCGRDDNLLDYSGDSITIARIHEEIDSAFPGAIMMSQMFIYPTVALLAEYIFTCQKRKNISTEMLNSDGISADEAIALLERM